MTTTEQRIYAASLTDYNAGILHGAWIEVSDPETMREEIAAMLRESPTAKEEGTPAEEWAIHDYEGFGDIDFSEYEDLETLCSVAEATKEHGDAFLAWAAHEPNNTDVSDFEDCYQGEWASLADYVEHYWQDCGGAPEAPEGTWWHPANYIDWERMAHDLELNGEVWTAEASKGVYVFSNG